MNETIKTATRKQKTDFINAKIQRKGKKIPKKELESWPDQRIDQLCEQFSDIFEDYIKTPPAKLIKFMADCQKGDDICGYDGTASSMAEFIKMLKEDSANVIRAVPAKGHHRCMYCGSIAGGTQKDILCDDCQDLFGHYSYNEL